jgi:hypothetical protein
MKQILSKHTNIEFSFEDLGVAVKTEHQLSKWFER